MEQTQIPLYHPLPNPKGELVQSVVHNIYHPATLQLLRFRGKAKLNSLASSFKSPRRKLISIVAIVLGFIWLSQAIASVMLRESAARADLIQWIPLGLLSYTIWHLIKTVSRSPVEPFEWTPAEDEYVRAAPVTRTQLISYRLTSIFSASLVKAVCFSVVMIPDLEIWALGLLGMFLGLVLVDLLRVCFELVFHGLTKTSQKICRFIVLGSAVSVGISVVSQCLLSEHAKSEIASPGALLFFKRIVGELFALAQTQIGMLLAMPFKPFSELILTQQFSFGAIGWMGASLLMVGGFAFTIYQLDRWMLRRTAMKEKSAYQAGLKLANRSKTEKLASAKRVRTPWRLKGFGSVAWRQLLGAYHFRTTLLISLGLPTILCCIPLFAKHNPLLMLINVVGGAVFYSFLLLPAALILDFRRDIDRMAVLKALPISPLAMTLGQLAAPVLLCSLFQSIVLVIASVSGAVIGWQAFIAAVLLIPINILIFGIENFIFMLAPFRRNEEGIGVFVRTILTFTGKGVLFGTVAAITLLWAFGSHQLTNWIGAAALGPFLFAGGIWLMASLAATGFVIALARLYARFDPSQDLPAIS